MIDIKLLREDPEIFRENMKKKGRDTSVINKVLSLDEKWRELKTEDDNLRAERNKISEEINKAKKEKNEKKAKELIKRAGEIPDKLKKNEAHEEKIYLELQEEILKVPNLMHSSVPKGKDDKENVVRKTFGKPTRFDFTPKTHVEIAENLGLADFEASAKTSGKGFYYLKNELALLNRALINFTIDFMIKKGYSYIEPPLMVNRDIAAAAGDLNAFKLALYKIESEDLFMIPTAEHAILGMLRDETLREEKLP